MMSTILIYHHGIHFRFSSLHIYAAFLLNLPVCSGSSHPTGVCSPFRADTIPAQACLRRLACLPYLQLPNLLLGEKGKKKGMCKDFFFPF